MSHSLDSNYLDNTPIERSVMPGPKLGDYNSSYEYYSGKAASAWDSAAPGTKEAESLLDEWEFVDSKGLLSDNGNSKKIKEKTQTATATILSAGTTAVGGMQYAGVGGFCLKHALGFWGYATVQTQVTAATGWTGALLSACPAVFQQYVTANTAAATAAAVTDFAVKVPMLGVVSAGTLATGGAAIVVGVAAVAIGQVAYNATRTFEEEKVDIGLFQTAKSIATKVGFGS